MDRSFVLKATLIAGMVDAWFAMAMTASNGGDVVGMWRGVAAGPFGDAASGWGLGGSLLGLGVHFALMAGMAAVFAALMRRPAFARVHWVVFGIAYGLATYLMMYGVALPLRFGAPFPQTDPARIASALFAHVVLVGLLMAWLFRRMPQPA